VGLTGYGERLRELRTERGLTLRQVEERGGPSKDTMSSAERGVHKPNTKTVAKIAKALGMSAAHLQAELEPSSVATASPPSVEWALAASDEDYDRWIETAPAPDLHKAFIALDQHAHDIESKALRAYILERSQKAIDKFFKVMGPITDWIDRRPNTNTELDAPERRQAAG
jgi:transcriptional regulator with XRE-family HTH domain